MNINQYQISILRSTHDKNAFSSGVQQLDRYLTQQASQDLRRNISVTYVLTKTDSAIVTGYYTLSSTSIYLNLLPNEMEAKLPRYPTLPSTLIGRLAVDEKYQGKKLGEKLLIDALKRSLKASKKIGSLAVIVDAKNDNAMQFYQSYGFIQFNEIPDRLFIPMAIIAKTWDTL